MILIGTKCRLEQTVTAALTAADLGSGALPEVGLAIEASRLVLKLVKKIL